jgi:hypothetical protein
MVTKSLDAADVVIGQQPNIGDQPQVVGPRLRFPAAESSSSSRICFSLARQIAGWGSSRVNSSMLASNGLVTLGPVRCKTEAA